MMKKKLYMLAGILALTLFPGRADAQFAARGHWMLGGIASYTNSSTANLALSVISSINGSGYNISFSPDICYFVKDNMGIGMQITYGRKMTDLDSASASVSDTSVDASEGYSIAQTAGASVYLREFIPLGTSGRFSMKADIGCLGSITRGKDIDGHSGYIEGSWWEKKKLRFYVNPGFYAFISDRTALSLSVGLIDFGIVNGNQVKNQVGKGGSKRWNGSFITDLGKIGIGLNFYI